LWVAEERIELAAGPVLHRRREVLDRAEAPDARALAEAVTLVTGDARTERDQASVANSFFHGCLATTPRSGAPELPVVDREISEDLGQHHGHRGESRAAAGSGDL